MSSITPKLTINLDKISQQDNQKEDHKDTKTPTPRGGGPQQEDHKDNKTSTPLGGLVSSFRAMVNNFAPSGNKETTFFNNLGKLFDSVLKITETKPNNNPYYCSEECLKKIKGQVSILTKQFSERKIEFIDKKKDEVQNEIQVINQCQNEWEQEFDAKIMIYIENKQEKEFDKYPCMERLMSLYSALHKTFKNDKESELVLVNLLTYSISTVFGDKVFPGKIDDLFKTIIDVSKTKCSDNPFFRTSECVRVIKEKVDEVTALFRMANQNEFLRPLENHIAMIYANKEKERLIRICSALQNTYRDIESEPLVKSIVDSVESVFDKCADPKKKAFSKDLGIHFFEDVEALSAFADFLDYEYAVPEFSKLIRKLIDAEEATKIKMQEIREYVSLKNVLNCGMDEKNEVIEKYKSDPVLAELRKANLRLLISAYNGSCLSTRVSPPGEYPGYLFCESPEFLLMLQRRGLPVFKLTEATVSTEEKK